MNHGVIRARLDVEAVTRRCPPLAVFGRNEKARPRDLVARHAKIKKGRGLMFRGVNAFDSENLARVRNQEVVRAGRAKVREAGF